MAKDKEHKQLLDEGIADAIMELPHVFYVNEERFFLYPLTLGKTFLIERAMRELKINKLLLATNPNIEALRLCHEEKGKVCSLIAYHTFNKKDDLVDSELIKQRADFFANNIDEEDLAKLFLIVNMPDKYEDFEKHLGITEERKWQKKAMQAKKDSDAMTFGGKSIYGTLIDFACDRYGWTYDYVVWGVSYINLRLLMADVVNTIYLDKDERKRVRVPKDRTKISGDDPKNIERLKQMLK